MLSKYPRVLVALVSASDPEEVPEVQLLGLSGLFGVDDVGDNCPSPSSSDDPEEASLCVCVCVCACMYICVCVQDCGSQGSGCKSLLFD